MFQFLKKKNPGNTNKDIQKVKLSIEGMHCSSCSLNIDGALEELSGVVQSSTSYAQSKTVVSFDPNKVGIPELQATIKELGYGAKCDDHR